MAPSNDNDQPRLTEGGCACLPVLLTGALVWAALIGWALS